jgi:hypothetical protein
LNAAPSFAQAAKGRALYPAARDSTRNSVSVAESARMRTTKRPRKAASPAAPQMAADLISQRHGIERLGDHSDGTERLEMLQFARLRAGRHEFVPPIASSGRDDRQIPPT